MSEEYFQSDEILGKAYDARILKRLAPYLKPYLFQTIAGGALVVSGMLLFLVNPYLLGYIVDNGIKPKNLNLVTNFALIYLFIEILVFLTTYVQGYLLQYIGQKVMFDIRSQLFSHIQRMPIQFFDKNPVGRLVTRTTNDVAALAELFSAGLVVVVGDVVLILGISVALLLLQPVLGLTTLLVIPLLILAAYFFQSRIRHTYRIVRLRIAKINALLSESISGIKVIQIFSQEKERTKKFDLCNSDHRDAQLESVFFHSIFTPIVTVINGFSIAIIILLGGNMAIKGEISIGILVSFLSYAQHLFFPIRDISEKFHIFQGAMASAERIFQLLDQPEETDIDTGSELADVRGEITFENVSFAYVPDENVLENVSFRILPNQSVAIVGHTGAGKTTITSLLNRFYDIQGGKILLDGVEVKTLSKTFLRSRIGVVQQDVFIFSGSLLENIRLGNQNISREQAISAAGKVHADDFIRNLPDSYDADLAERGATISIGQRQLLSFARALCNNPKILLLDEATSSIDTETEKIIQCAINDLTVGRTSIIIAHRLSTIRHCDRILVMNKGKIIEEGTHEELLSQKGHYQKLYELQFKEEMIN